MENVRDQICGGVENKANRIAEKTEATFAQGLSRRAFLGQLSTLSAAFLIGCTPLRILLKSYPDKFDTDRQLEDSVLRAFVTTVIPGAPPEETNLTRIYRDIFYPFQKYCGFFVSDLCQRSAKLYGRERFDLLLPSQRTQVIESGLDADATTARLYRGAILMAQVSCYGGIYDAERGCPLIDFHGPASAFEGEMFYPLSGAGLARESTLDGNFS